MIQRFPFPAFPSGWFAVAFSTELERGAVERRRFMGEEVVVYRTAAGRAAVMNAHCPHMGAHFGHGGTVHGERLRCPMHAFEFDVSGACVATGYGTRPPARCRASAWHVREEHGAVFAWFDPAAGEPAFELPRMDYDGWTPLRTHCFADLRSHPQETTENSVDIGHFGAVHRYRNVSLRRPLELAGAHLSVAYHFERAPLFPGAPEVAADISIQVHGLGFSFVDVDLPAYGLRSRNLVLPTPTDGERIDLRVGLRMQGSRLGTRLLPTWLLDRVLGAAAMRTYVGDVHQDQAIWENKRYVHPPALADGDGPIGKYRRWARQFYATPGAPEATP